MSYGKAKNYGPNGCGKCGETKTLNILNEFKSLYEKRMEQLEEEARAGGDCLQAKLHLQEQWIKDLMEQNEMMARAVEQLEIEATERVQMLEEKLQSSARCICEKEEEIQEQGRKISDLTKKTDKMDKFGEPEELLGRLKKKEEDLNELKQSMVDMRKALTEEVASKHDIICALNKDIQQLEEQCLQADKQTAFKEDIIKELRKEIKQLKQQKTQSLEEDNESTRSSLEDYKKENDSLKGKIEEEKKEIAQLEKQFKEFLKEKEDLRKKLKDAKANAENATESLAKNEVVCKKYSKELTRLKEEVERLQNELDLTKKDKRDLQSQINDLEHEVSRLKKEKDKCSKKCDEMEKELEKLKEEKSELSSENEDLIKLKKEKKKDSNKINDLNDKISDLEGEVSDLKKKLAEANKAKKDCEEKLKDEAAKLKLKIAETDAQLLDCQRKSMIQDKPKTSSDSRIICICKVVPNKGLQISERCPVHNRSSPPRRLPSPLKIPEPSSPKPSTRSDSHKVSIKTTPDVRIYCPKTQTVLKDTAEDESLSEFDRAYREDFGFPELESEINETKTSNSHKSTRHTRGSIDDLSELDKAFRASSDSEIDDVELKNKSIQSEKEKEQKSAQVDELSSKICCLEAKLVDCHGRADNLQTADDKAELKKELRKLKIQKKSYEEVIQYFQYEVRVMSDQLQNLQDILNMSNESCQVETAQLTEAIENLKRSNEELCGRLCGTEQRFLLESQMNQINEARIEELQAVICQKDLEIQHFECAVEDMKGSLENCLKRNQELECDICCLNHKIMELEDTIKAYEQEQLQHMENNTACQTQINFCEQNLCELRGLLEAKNEALEELRTEYNTQFNILVATQNELMRLKEGHEEKQQTVSRLNNTICECKNENGKLCAEIASLKQKLRDITSGETSKDTEIKEYQKVIQELRQSLKELNNNLAEIEKANRCLCQEKNHLDEISKQTKKTLQTCQCEIASYAQMTEDLKQLVCGLKKQLAEKDNHIKNLEDQCSKNKSKLAEICKKECKKEKDYQELIQQLAHSNSEEKRLKDEIKLLERDLQCMREDIRKKDEQLKTFRENLQQIKSGKKLQDSCLQEENNAMKNEINILRQKQVRMKQENEELQCQLCRAQKRISDLEERNLIMKEQLEQYLLELDSLQNEKEIIEQKNQQLSDDITALQNSFACMKKQNRVLSHQIQSQQQQQQQQPHQQMNTNQCCMKRTASCKSPPPSRGCPTLCKYPLRREPSERSCSPWSLGSQGTASLGDPRESPCGSMCEPCYSFQDWYSPTYRDGEDSDVDDEENWVAKVEHLTAQFKKANKAWKNKIRNAEYCVTKDDK